MRHDRLAACTLVLVVLMAGKSVQAAEEQVFEMQEISILAEARANEEFAGDAFEGPDVFVQTERPDEVKRYPQFQSSQPQYGILTFGEEEFVSSSPLHFHVALDESAPRAAPAAESSSWLGSLIGRLLGRSPDAPLARYDRLYVDVNRDLDLTNDPVLTVAKDPAAIVPAQYLDEQTIVFEYLTVSLDFGPELGSRPVRVLPVLHGEDASLAWLTFVLPVARKGEIRVGERAYTAILRQQQTITGRFDRPFTRLQLTARDGSAASSDGWGGDLLCVMREEAGQLYRFRTTPTGDKLIVEPYRGEFGLLEVRAGNRQLERIGICNAGTSGWLGLSLRSPSRIANACCTSLGLRRLSPSHPRSPGAAG